MRIAETKVCLCFHVPSASECGMCMKEQLPAVSELQMPSEGDRCVFGVQGQVQRCWHLWSKLN